MIRTDDTIAALATAPGAAGLAVVRVSGHDAVAIADTVFRGRGRLASVASHTLHHGRAADAAGRVLDEVVAAVFRAPRSYTREDVVELSCHGGVAGPRVLRALIAAGARAAGAGEFTLRAFLNGRIDLAQAEAVADVVRAESDAAHALALSQLGGALSRRLEALAEPLADAAAEIEARVDFAEDVGGVEVPAHACEAIAAAAHVLDALLASSAWARAVRSGARVVIAGAPNAGKSSLFNALLGESRAIVSAEAGTTRDIVSESLDIAGVRVTLQDTAGLRDARDGIESQGVARARAAADTAAIVLWVIDASVPLAADDPALAAAHAHATARVVANGHANGATGAPADMHADAAADASDGGAARARGMLVALGKCDRPRAVSDELLRARLGAGVRVVPTSATERVGLDALREAIAHHLGAGMDADGHAATGMAGAVSHPRHVDALERARAALARARDTARAGAPGEIVALELRDALGCIGEVTGRNLGEELLERIFSRFCIGK